MAKLINLTFMSMQSRADWSIKTPFATAASIGAAAWTGYDYYSLYGPRSKAKWILGDVGSEFDPSAYPRQKLVKHVLTPIDRYFNPQKYWFGPETEAEFWKRPAHSNRDDDNRQTMREGYKSHQMVHTMSLHQYNKLQAWTPDAGKKLTKADLITSGESRAAARNESAAT